MQEVKADVGMKWDPVRAVGLAFLKASEKLRQGG